MDESTGIDYDRQPYFLILCILFLAPVNFPLNKIHEAIAGTPSDERYEKDFYLNGSKDYYLMRKCVNNEAIVQINCHLFANSTSNITLIVKPESEWNVSHIQVGIGQKITVIVTNGVVRTPPSDVPAAFELRILLTSSTAEVWGQVLVVIVTRGWEPISWPLLPVIIALLGLYITRQQKRKTGDSK